MLVRPASFLIFPQGTMRRARKLKRVTHTDKPFNEAIVDENYFLNFERYLQSENLTELVNKLNFYYEGTGTNI